MNPTATKPESQPEILVADDTPASLRLLEQILTRNGCQVRPASSGQLALRSIAAKKPDLILLDVIMPDVDGYEVCRQLKADPATREIPVLFISALDDPADKVKGFQAGGLDYITKPFHAEEVLSRIRIHWRLRELTEHLEQKVQERTQELTLANQALKEKIDSQKKTEAALLASELRFRTLVENLPMRVFIKDRHSVYVACSPSYASDLKIRTEDVAGKTDYDFYPRELAEKYRSDDQWVMESQCRKEVEEPCVLDGQSFWVQTFKTPIRNAHGAVDGILGVFWDITERKKTQEALAKLEIQFQQAQKMESLGQLAGGVAHDFNNMLQAILANTSLLLRDIPISSPWREGVEEISQCARRSAELTQQLLAFARRQFIVPKVLDLNQTVGGMISMLRRLIGENIELAWHPGTNLSAVKMDPTQVSQILANLCVNARDAIKNAGTITIETSNASLDENNPHNTEGVISGKYVLLTVSDNGSGMDQTVLPHLFEPFFTTKGIGKGTGLGLATVYGVIKQNRGFILVNSQLGQGTTFKIYLPQHEGALPESLPELASTTINGAGETILLVEDEATLLNVGRKILTQLGYGVLAANTPAQALELATHQPIHLLMTDVIMPEMNGLDLARQLAANHPQLKCLFMSGYPADVIAHHGILDDRVHFIQKPFSAESLAAKVRAILTGQAVPHPAPSAPVSA